MFITHDVRLFYNMANTNEMRRFVNVMSDDKKARPAENIPSVSLTIIRKKLRNLFNQLRRLPRRRHGR